MNAERTALDILQRRVDQIEATGNDDLAARAWHALSHVLLDYLRRDLNLSEPNATDLRMFLQRNARLQ